MSWRHVRALTLLLLGLLLAAPLSSGDKGLWLSLAASPIQHLAVAANGLPVEHATVLPQKALRPLSAARSERLNPTKLLGGPAPAWNAGPGASWSILDLAPFDPRGELLAVRPAPRAPPAW
jgi:hypothetical protein